MRCRESLMEGNQQLQEDYSFASHSVFHHDNEMTNARTANARMAHARTRACRSLSKTLSDFPDAKINIHRATLHQHRTHLTGKPSVVQPTISGPVTMSTRKTLDDPQDQAVKPSSKKRSKKSKQLFSVRLKFPLLSLSINPPHPVQMDEDVLELDTGELLDNFTASKQTRGRQHV